MISEQKLITLLDRYIATYTALNGVEALIVLNDLKDAVEHKWHDLEA